MASTSRPCIALGGGVGSLPVAARPLRYTRRASVRVQAAAETETKTQAKSDIKGEAEEATLKFGLEAGLLKTLTSKDADAGAKASSAKDLLKRYGSAYLITSISFAIVSFSLCYALVDQGVDVPALLAKVGISADAKGEQVGTVAIAYAAHKAASPIRFPPTVALTPVVAKWLGKEVNDEANEES